jgi:hypothetical protein
MSKLRFDFIPTTKWFCSALLRAGTPNHFESSMYSREKVGRSPNLFGSGMIQYRTSLAVKAHQGANTTTNDNP